VTAAATATNHHQQQQQQQPHLQQQEHHQLVWNLFLFRWHRFDFAARLLNVQRATFSLPHIFNVEWILHPVVGRVPQSRFSYSFHLLFIIVLFRRAFICLFVCSLCARLPHQGKLCPSCLILFPFFFSFFVVVFCCYCFCVFIVRAPPAKWDLLLLLFFYTLNIVSIKSENFISFFIRANRDVVCHSILAESPGQLWNWLFGS